MPRNIEVSVVGDHEQAVHPFASPERLQGLRDALCDRRTDVERGVRSTGVDELFELAIVLATHVVTLLDPYLSGSEDEFIDMGIPLPEDLTSAFARSFILTDSDPWRLDRWDDFTQERYEKYRSQYPKIREDRRERERLEKARAETSPSEAREE